jgi:hypothetical protein
MEKRCIQVFKGALFITGMSMMILGFRCAKGKKVIKKL